MRALALSVGRASGVHLADAMMLAEAAEAAGFGIVTTGEGPAECFSVLGALAMRTSRVELFSSIATWTRTPVTTALAAGTLAELSGGRFRLGLGTMPRQWNEAWHEIDYEQPVERMRDYVAAVRAALTARPDAPATHEGPFYRFHNYSNQPLRQPAADGVPGVPIYLAALRPKMSELAGEIADGAIINLQHTASWLDEVLMPSLQRGLERAGRDRASLDVGVLALCSIDDDPAVAFELARPGVGYFFQLPYFGDVLEHHGLDADLERFRAVAAGRITDLSAVASDEAVDLIALAGTPAQVREKLRRYEGIVDFVQLAGPLLHSAEVTLEQAWRRVATFAPNAGH